jgi:hypothetical protein
MMSWRVPFEHCAKSHAELFALAHETTGCKGGSFVEIARHSGASPSLLK